MRSELYNLKELATNIGKLVFLLSMMTSCSYEKSHKFLIGTDIPPLRVVAWSCRQPYNGSVSDKVSQGEFPVKCDGPLIVKATYTNYQVECKIGYISYGELPKKWIFEIRNRTCRSISVDSINN